MIQNPKQQNDVKGWDVGNEWSSVPSKADVYALVCRIYRKHNSCESSA